MKDMKAIEFILYFLSFNMNFNKNNSYHKKLIRNQVKDINLKRSFHNKKVYVLKLDYNSINNIKLDLNVIKASNFKILTLLDLLHIKHNTFYEKNSSFNLIKNIKFISYVFYDYDKTNIYLAFFNEKDYLNFRNNFFKINSFKYKANFSSYERKLLFKLKNNLCKEKYSYNFNYLLEIKDNIISIEKEIAKIEKANKLLDLSYQERKAILNDLKYYCKFNYTTIGNRKAIEFLEKELNSIANESYSNLFLIDELELQLQELTKLYDELTYSNIEKETLINDYY